VTESTGWLLLFEATQVFHVCAQEAKDATETIMKEAVASAREDGQSTKVC
jgi:hypothetical protein